MNIVMFGFFQEATGLSGAIDREPRGDRPQDAVPAAGDPLAVVMTALFNLMLNLVVVFVFILAFGVTPTWTWLLLPVVIALLATLTLAIG